MPINETEWFAMVTGRMPDGGNVGYRESPWRLIL